MADENVKTSMIQWAQNVGKVIAYETRGKYQENVRYFKSTSYRENYPKIFHRWHLPPATLAKMFNICNKYWKCNKEVGTYFHTWWTCKEAKTLEIGMLNYI